MRRPASPLSCLLLLLSLSCGSEGSECRSSDDCRGELECAGPNDPPACGIPATIQCGGDGDCFEQRCHAVLDPCSPDGIGTVCGPACVDGGCGEGLRCGAEGACEPIPCNEGDPCPGHQLCDAAAVGPFTDGCVTITCNDEGACPEGGACVNGSCQDGPGSCTEVMLIP